MDSMKLFWGLVVVFIGMTLIGQNLGWWSVDIWWLIFSLWPIILIALGLKLMLKNDKILGILLLALVVGSAIFVVVDYNKKIENRFNQFNNKVYNQELIDTFSSTEIDNIKIIVNTGAAKVSLKSFSETENNNKLYQIKSSNMGKFDISKTIRERTATIEISEESTVISPIGRGIGGTRRLDIELPESLLLDFTLKGGASKLDLDFSNLRVTETHLSIGASSGDIYLSDKENRQNLRLDAGASTITFHSSRDLGIKATMEGGLINISYDDLPGFTKEDSVYTSQGFLEKSKQIMIDGNTGVSTIRFECTCAV